MERTTNKSFCKAQTNHFPKAVYKSFKTRLLAEQAFTDEWWEYIGKDIFETELTPEQLLLVGKPIEESISVDGAWNTGTRIVEYQGVHTKTKEPIFKIGPFEDGTNNIVEFLGIVHALAHCKKHNITLPIYSDSRNAIGWVRDKQARTNHDRSDRNTKLFELINRAVKWLNENEYENEVLKWEQKHGVKILLTSDVNNTNIKVSYINKLPNQLITTKTDLSSLNDKQREAVVSEDKRLLVLAGAGSGKTKTLLQKLIYLIEEKGVSPLSILAITFTKNTTNEMIDRLIISADNTGQYENMLFDKQLSKADKDKERFNNQKKYKWIDGLTVRTFHSFCYSILRNYGVNEFDNKFRIIGDEKPNEEDELSKHVAPETIFEVVHKLLIEQCEDTEFLLQLKRYILDYIIDKIHLKKNEGKYLPKDGKYFTTLDGTKVRSKSEQFIADWFYRHSIKYEYEPLLNVKDFVFRPDFFVPEANLYIEHVTDKSFPIKDKEEQFQKGNLLLVKTYESMTKDSALFNHTLDKVVKNRLPANYHKTVSLNYKEEFNGYHEDVKDFVAQIMRITDMIKIENIDIDSVLANARRDQHERVRNFYELAIPIVKKYIHYCTDKSYLDFNDLISRSTSLFQNYEDISNKYKSKYQYILVDEFQDVNNLQVDLIKLLLTDQTQLFCVGDDWQSIYGFRGSNVSYIVDFENYFPNSKLVKLNLNYRSTQNIVGASNEVIKHNKFKVEKEIHSSKISEHKIVVYAGGSEDENIQFCLDKVRELQNTGLTSEDILFLYRRTHMYNPGAYSGRPSYSKTFYKEGIKVQAKTIHAAKGLEAKVVFIIGLTDGNGGFPDIWLEDRIFQVIKKANHDLLMEEERRLFYVAITRAKDKLFLITEKGNESSFLKEIPDIFTVKTSIPIKSVVEKVITCKKCFSQLEKLWVACPYCMEKVTEETNEQEIK